MPSASSDPVPSGREEAVLGGLLNLQRQLPQVPVPATVRVLPPPGRRVERVLRLPSLESVAFASAGPYV